MIVHIENPTVEYVIQEGDNIQFLDTKNNILISNVLNATKFNTVEAALRAIELHNQLASIQWACVAPLVDPQIRQFSITQCEVN